MKISARQWISFSLLSLMLVKVWVIPLLYLDFEIRREYIVANLCENRNRPMMHCDGKCYLAKRISALDEQDKRQAEKTYISRIIDQVMDERSAFHLPLPACPESQNTSQSFSYQSPFAASVATDEIFHPPLC